MLKDLALGFRSYLMAIRFIIKHKLWVYFFFPMLMFVFIYYLGATFEEWKIQASTATTEDDIWVKIIRALEYGLYTALAFMVFKFMRYILIILLSPVLSIVSERVERIIAGNVYKFNLKQLIKDIKRTINLSIRNLIWEFGTVYSIYLIIAIFSWVFSIPEQISTMLETSISMLIGFYYYGFSFIDYLNERRRLSISESVTFVKKHKGFAIALGSVFTLLFHYSNIYFVSIKDDLTNNAFMTLVIFSSVIMSIIPIITIVAATLGVHELVDLTTNPYALKNKESE